MKLFAGSLVGAVPVAMEYGWLVASLSAAQAATPTARAHELALREARVENPRQTLLAALAQAAEDCPGAFHAGAAAVLPEP